MTSRQASAGKTARQVALEVLNRFDRGQGDLQTILHQELSTTEHKSRATDLTYGSLRHQMTLDRVLRILGDVQPDRVAKPLMNILRMGVYELVYSPQTAVYGIVDENAQLAARMGGTKQIGFVNAVLRGVGRAIEQRTAPMVEGKERYSIPQTAKAACVFSRAILPDISGNPEEYLSEAFSLPKWLMGRWLEEFGPETTRQICLGSNRRPSVFIQPNSFKTVLAALAERFSRAGLEYRIGGDGRWMAIHPGVSVTELPGYDEGWFHVVDPAAAGVADRLEPKAGERILDLCAAPGGKTILMAQMMNNDGILYATDAEPARLDLVRRNCARMGIENVQLVPYSQLSERVGSKPFDAILADVPCSNSGVMARRAEVRYRINERGVSQLAERQRAILRRAAEWVRPGGRVIYSTCSILREENRDVVERLINEYPDFVCTSAQLTLPRPETAESMESDGGFAAVLRRKKG